MNEPAHIYTLTDPSTGKVRYVGSSIHPHKRVAAHMNPSIHDGIKKKEWVKDMKRKGVRPILTIIQTVHDVDYERWHEFVAIRRHVEAGCNLVNVVGVEREFPQFRVKSNGEFPPIDSLSPIKGSEPKRRNPLSKQHRRRRRIQPFKK